MSEESRKKMCACILVPVFLTSVILFAVSFDTLDPHQIGIKYNNNLKVIDTQRVYNNGRYFLGLGLSFIEFPIKAMLIEFKGRGALRMWSYEGQLVVVDLSLMYRLQRQNVVKIYERYEEDYATRLTQIAIRTAKKVSIQYTAEDFFRRRTLVGTHMRSELRRRLKDEFCTLELFNLRKIDIPSKFESKVVQKQIWEQVKKTRMFESETAVLRANKTIMEGIANAKINLMVTNATAIQKQSILTAQAEANKKITSQEAVSYQEVQKELGIDAAMILKYRYSQLMEKLKNSGSDKRQLQYFIGMKKKYLNLKN